MSQLIVNAGGVAAIIDFVGDTKGNVRLPGIMMLGYVAAHSENLAMAVIVSKVRMHCKYVPVFHYACTFDFSFIGSCAACSGFV